MFCKYCNKLQQHPAITRNTKIYATHFHCFGDSCQLPANAMGKSKRGSFILTKRSHIFLSSVQNQVRNGIRKRKPIPNKNRFLTKQLICVRIFLWKHVRNKKSIELIESKNLEVKTDISINTIEKKMSCCFESLSMLIPIFL